MYEQEVKMHIKEIKMQDKIIKNKNKIGEQSNKQSLVQPDKVVSCGVTIISRGDVKTGTL